MLIWKQDFVSMQLDEHIPKSMYINALSVYVGITKLIYVHMFARTYILSGHAHTFATAYF